MTTPIVIAANTLLNGKDYLYIDSSKRSSGIAENF